MSGSSATKPKVDATGEVQTTAGLHVPLDHFRRVVWTHDEWRRVARVLGWFTREGIGVVASCTYCEKQIVKVDTKHQPPGCRACYICGCRRREVV